MQATYSHILSYMQTLFLEVVARRVPVSKWMNVMYHVSHPLHGMFSEMKSARNNRVTHPRCNRGCHWRSFLPTAIRLHSSSAMCAWTGKTLTCFDSAAYMCFSQRTLYIALFTPFSPLQFKCIIYLYIYLFHLSVHPHLYCISCTTASWGCNLDVKMNTTPNKAHLHTQRTYLLAPPGKGCWHLQTPRTRWSFLSPGYRCWGWDLPPPCATPHRPFWQTHRKWPLKNKKICHFDGVLLTAGLKRWTWNWILMLHYLLLIQTMWHNLS